MGGRCSKAKAHGEEEGVERRSEGWRNKNAAVKTGARRAGGSEDGDTNDGRQAKTRKMDETQQNSATTRTHTQSSSNGAHDGALQSSGVPPHSMGADATDGAWIEQAKSTEELVHIAEKRGILDGQFKELESMYASDGDMGEIISTYTETVDEMLDKLDHYLCKDEPDFQDARSVLHTLRGTSATFGAKLVLEAGEGVREHCKNCDAAGAYSGSGGIGDLRRAVELMRRVMNRYSELQYNNIE